MTPSSHLYYILIQFKHHDYKNLRCRASGFPGFQISAVLTAESRSMLDMLIEGLFWKWRRHPNNDVCSLPLPALSSGRNPQIQSYLINTPFSFLACTFLLFLTLLHEHWVTISHVFYTDSLKLQSDLRSFTLFFQNPSDWQFHWLWILLILWFQIAPMFLRIAKPHHPPHLGTWLNWR